MSKDAAKPHKMPCQKCLRKHCPPWEAVLRKCSPFELRHDPPGKKCSRKAQRAIKKEICRKPSGMLLIVGEDGQQLEKQLTESEKQKDKNRKSPTRPNSLRANKNALLRRCCTLDDLMTLLKA